MTRQIPFMAWRKVPRWIIQWKFIMTISTVIQNIYYKLWIYYSIDVNLHTHHNLYFSERIRKIAPVVEAGTTTNFQNYEGYYYIDTKYVWK